MIYYWWINLFICLLITYVYLLSHKGPTNTISEPVNPTLIAAVNPTLIAAVNPTLISVVNPTLIAAVNPTLIAAVNPTLIAESLEHVTIQPQDFSFVAERFRVPRAYTVNVHPTGTDTVSDSVRQQHVFEPHIMQRIAEVLGKATAPLLFVDIGANLGWHSLHALALGHRVVSIEPYSFNYKLLLASVAANPDFTERFRLVPRVLLDHDVNDGMCIISTYLHNKGNARLIRLQEPLSAHELEAGVCEGSWTRVPDGEIWVEHGLDGDRMTGELVQGARLDHVLRAGVDKIHLIKADAEGSETLALRGAAALLDDHQPCVVIFEYNQYVTEFTGVDGNAILRDFVNRGYRLFDIGGTVDRTPANIGPADARIRNSDWEFRLMTGKEPCRF